MAVNAQRPRKGKKVGITLEELTGFVHTGNIAVSNHDLARQILGQRESVTHTLNDKNSYTLRKSIDTGSVELFRHGLIVKDCVRSLLDEFAKKDHEEERSKPRLQVRQHNNQREPAHA